MELAPSEATFLKKQIIANHPETMLGWILRYNIKEALQCENFDDLSIVIGQFPPHIQGDYWLARQFSHFLAIIRTVYNIIVSDGKNEDANATYDALRPYLREEASVDLDAVISRLGIEANIALCKFLRAAKEHILNDDFDSLCKCIKNREILLKGTGRAKTAHPGEFDTNAWFGGFYLDYRFSNAKTIMNDIYEGEVAENVEP